MEEVEEGASLYMLSMGVLVILVSIALIMWAGLSREPTTPDPPPGCGDGDPSTPCDSMDLQRWRLDSQQALSDFRLETRLLQFGCLGLTFMGLWMVKQSSPTD